MNLPSYPSPATWRSDAIRTDLMSNNLRKHISAVWPWFLLQLSEIHWFKKRIRRFFVLFQVIRS